MHLLHPPPGELPPVAGGDALEMWVQAGAMLVLAAVAAGVWSALDRRRESP